MRPTKAAHLTMGLLVRHRPTRPSHPLHPPDAAAALEGDLAHLGDRAALARLALTALAWARGTGWPLENGWLPATRALANPGTRVTAEDLRWVISRCGKYVATADEPGGRRYRVRGAALASYLQARHGQAAETEDRITHALAAWVPMGRRGPDWPAAHPYLRSHLAEHAAAAGPAALGGLVGDLGFLAAADPQTLSPVLAATVPELRDVARAYQRSRPILGADPHANAAYLAEAFRALTGSAAAPNSVRPRYRTLLACVRQDDSLLTLTGHRGWVNSVAFGAGPGRLVLASGADDQVIRLWDPLTGTNAGELTGHTGWVGSLAFAHDREGRLLLASAGGDDQTARVWDVASGTPLGEPLTGHTGWVFSVAFGTLPDGRLLLASASYDATVRLWDPLTGEAVGEPLTGHTDIVNSVAFGTMSGDGEGGSQLLLASGSRDASVRLWDPVAGTPVGEPLTGHADAVFWVAFGAVKRDEGAAGGRLLLASAGEDKTVRLWDPAAGTPVGGPLTGHTGWVNSVAFGSHPDGRLLLASGSADHTVQVWDPLWGQPAGEPLAGHTGWVNAVAFGTSSDGRLLLASASDDQTVRVWDPLPAPLADDVPSGHTKWVDAVALGRDGDGQFVLASASDTAVQIWDVGTGGCVGEPLTGHTGPLRCVALGTTSTGRLLLASGGDDHTVRVWNALTGTQPDGPLAVHGGPVRAVAFGTVPGDAGAGGGRLLLASAGDDQLVRVWDPLTGEPLSDPLAGHAGWVDCVAFGTARRGRDAGGERLLLASAGRDETVRLWDPLTGLPVGGPLTGHTAPVRSVAFGTGPAGELLLASASDDQSALVWDLSAGVPPGTPPVRLEGHTAWVGAVAFGTVKGDREKGGERLLLATASGDHTIRIWDMAAKSDVTVLSRRTPVHALAAAGLVLAIGDDEGVSVVELDLFPGETPAVSPGRNGPRLRPGRPPRRRRPHRPLPWTASGRSTAPGG